MARSSSHNLTHHRLLSCSQGELVPAMVEEILPGDSFMMSTTVLARVAALVAPLMHPVNIRVHYWFVPSRLVWDNFEAFITGRDPDLTVPTVAVPTENYTSLLDHMGIPDVDDQVLNVLPMRAYGLIWNEFYRDQQLDTEVVVSTANGPDTTTSLALKKTRWGKDYFTTARPYPQLGDTSVSIPFSANTQAPVRGIGVGSATVNWETTTGTVNESGGNAVAAANSDGNRYETTMFIRQDAGTLFPDVYADLSEIEEGGIDVNDFRRSMARARSLEIRNRFGDRYTDMLAYLGVSADDARLQRPQYLGGGRRTIAFSEVLATAEGTNTNVGDMAGHGIASLRTPRVRKYFREHGYLFALVSVRPQLMYAQQLRRMWMRDTKDSFWQLENEAEGPQPVYKRELYAAAADPTAIFGWTGRHDEYRRVQSYVTGTFRTTEDDWHLARIFASEPSLNSAFLECTPRDDIYASSSDPQLYMMALHNIHARRLVSSHARF